MARLDLAGVSKRFGPTTALDGVEISLAPHLSVAENILLGIEPARGGFIRWAVQQLVEIARALAQSATRVLILDEPTRGIDVGSKAEIYALIDELALAGKAILIVTSYLPELLGVCDRVAVMHRGRLGDTRPASELTEHGVLMEAMGQA